MGAMQGIHCYIKSFYGRLSSILNNFDLGKTVSFSGFISERSYGVGAEYLRSGSNRSLENSLFTVSTKQLYSIRSGAVFFYNVTERISARQETK